MNTIRMYFAWFMGEVWGRFRWHCVRLAGGGDIHTGYMTRDGVKEYLGKLNCEVVFMDVERRTIMYRSRGGQ